ncbi:MAG: GtrA family protein, partial [Lachnospiraceae bacterium]|nr:GtrA family protein [Lachnospiraceae bacterium]
MIDFIKKYIPFLKFVTSSLTGSAVELLLFYGLCQVIPLPRVQMIYLATVISRVIAGSLNFLMNKFWSFGGKDAGFGTARSMGTQAVKYAILFVGKMLSSAQLVSMMPTEIPTVLSKAAVDTGIFFISYVIQKKWVFAEKKH